MKEHSFISPESSLGEDINCLTLTSHYFFENQIDPKKDALIKNLSFFEGIPIQYMDQVHGNSIGLVTTHNSEPIKSTDAIFTSKKGLALAALTADCMPIVLSKIDGSEFSIIHVGWKGLFSGIIEKSISSFATDGLEISAWIGPSISCRNYEVDNGFYKKFITKDKESESNFIKKDSEKWLFSLQGEAERILIKYGVHTQTTRICTYESELLYSFRKEQTQDRLVTIIWRSE